MICLQWIYCAITWSAKATLQSARNAFTVKEKVLRLCGKKEGEERETSHDFGFGVMENILPEEIECLKALYQCGTLISQLRSGDQNLIHLKIPYRFFQQNSSNLSHSWVLSYWNQFSCLEHSGHLKPGSNIWSLTRLSSFTHRKQPERHQHYSNPTQ